MIINEKDISKKSSVLHFVLFFSKKYAKSSLYYLKALLEIVKFLGYSEEMLVSLYRIPIDFAPQLF